jgi:hypothetical protein
MIRLGIAPGIAHPAMLLIAGTVAGRGRVHCDSGGVSRSREKPVFSSFFDEPLWHFCQFTDALFEITLALGSNTKVEQVRLDSYASSAGLRQRSKWT